MKSEEQLPRLHDNVELPRLIFASNFHLFPFHLPCFLQAHERAQRGGLRGPGLDD